MGDLKSSRVVLLAKGSSAKALKQGVVLIQPFNQLKVQRETAQGISGDTRKEGVQQSSLCSDLSQPPSFFTTSSGVQVNLHNNVLRQSEVSSCERFLYNSFCLMDSQLDCNQNRGA